MPENHVFGTSMTEKFLNAFGSQSVFKDIGGNVKSIIVYVEYVR